MMDNLLACGILGALFFVVLLALTSLVVAFLERNV